MIDLSEEHFARLVGHAMDTLHQRFEQANNVGVVIADEPTPEQRLKLQLRGDQTLFGLYEGIPLTARNNSYSGVLPDKITIFRFPICMYVNSEDELKEEIRHTLWHELAHHFGLNHEQIKNKE